MESLKKRRLVIKGFLMSEVAFAKATSLAQNSLTIADKYQHGELDETFRDFIKEFKVRIIKPQERQTEVNSIMDFVPVSTKVLGGLGEGITHTLLGVKVMLTGVDEDGVQAAEFGSSEGILSEQFVAGRPGTPDENDIIIHVDVTMNRGAVKVRQGINRCHELCDALVQELRQALKALNGRLCSERHEFFDEVKPGGRKVVILKQVAGQGAMSDTRILSKEPSGFDGGQSIIDLGNLPVLLTPNEYRDGAVRAMH